MNTKEFNGRLIEVADVSYETLDIVLATKMSFAEIKLTLMLLHHPNAEFSTAELMQLTGLSKSSVLDGLRRVNDRGIVKHNYTIPGWVYVLSSEIGLYKIGMTVKDLDKRVNDINNMSPVPVELSIAVHCADPRLLESRLHKQFAHKRQHGEWFRLDIDDYSTIVTLFTEERLKL